MSPFFILPVWCSRIRENLAGYFPRRHVRQILTNSATTFLAVLVVVTLAACGKRETAVQIGNREQVLHVGLAYEVVDLDPHLLTGVSEIRVLDALFEGLVNLDPTDLHPVPGVAERWEVSSDQSTYTFYLRANARWSNGQPVTAQDFVASWRRILTASLGADNASQLFLIQGAEAFHKGAAPFEQVGLAAPDARTLRVTLDHPTPYFLSLLANLAWLPVPTATIEKSGPLYQRGNHWTRTETIVTNGPFVLKSWKPNEELVFEKSPSYWDAATVRLHAVHFHPIDSLDVQERAFRAGQLHVIDNLPVGKIDGYRRDNASVLRLDPYLATYFYRLNLKRAPFSDVRIRRALAMSIDRTALTEKVLRGVYRPASTLTPPGTAGYTFNAKGIVSDLTEARRLLADAGYPGGKGLPKIELLYNNSETHRLIAEAVQEMWRRELGVEVQLVNQELKVVFSARRTGDYQVLRSDWVGDYNDPSTFLEVFRSDSGNNYTGWANSDYDAALFAAARTSDPAARLALFQKAEGILLEAVPIIPIYYYTHVFLLQPSVKGWNPTILDVHPLKHVWLEP
jgi:oligopeptide transport system substrate-binding protein